MRPSARLLGVLVLGVILYLVGGDYEVPWLLLIALLVWATIPGCLLYALVNDSRLEGTIELAGSASSAEHTFEGDRPVLRLRLAARRGEWGPARVIGESGEVLFAAARVAAQGLATEIELARAVRRGPIDVPHIRLETADPLGLFRARRPLRPAAGLALPRFRDLGLDYASQHEGPDLTAPRAGAGEEVLGVREFRPGDPLRRIHWRSSARRGELVVREYEPPATPTLLVLCPGEPGDRDAADVIARRAASEVHTVLERGGRAYLGGPGLPTTRTDEAGNLWALLEWLALYPDLPAQEGGLMPRVGEAVAAGDIDAESLEQMRLGGVRVRQ